MTAPSTRARKRCAAEACPEGRPRPKAGGASCLGIGPPDRNGSLIWEVGILGKEHQSHDVTVDAGNGKVLDQHVDQDDNGSDSEGD